VEVRNANDFQAAFAAIKRENAQALILIQRALLTLTAATARLGVQESIASDVRERARVD
jgi:hypothetical protein